MKMMKKSALAATVLVWALAGCSRAEEVAAAAAPSLDGTSWTVTAIEGQAPIVGRVTPSIAFDGEGRASGSTGCNGFSGGLAVGADGALSLGGEDAAIVTTRMACTPDLNAQERRMLAALGEVARYAVGADGRLTLSNAAGEAVVVAEPAEAEEE
jgi:heat shock protein HslJ